MAYIKKKSERKFKITVCNGYKVNGQKRMKAQTITVPSSVFNAHANQIALTVKTKNNVQIIRAAESVPSSADREVQWLTLRKNPNENSKSLSATAIRSMGRNG